MEGGEIQAGLAIPYEPATPADTASVFVACDSFH